MKQLLNRFSHENGNDSIPRLTGIMLRV